MKSKAQLEMSLLKRLKRKENFRSGLESSGTTNPFFDIFFLIKFQDEGGGRTEGVRELIPKQKRFQFFEKK